MEPVRRLPAMVAAALPPTDAQLSMGVSGPAAAPLQQPLLPTSLDLSPVAAEQLRGLMREEVQMALQAISGMLAQVRQQREQHTQTDTTHVHFGCCYPHNHSSSLPDAQTSLPISD
jgi:hypothetical protein